MGSTVEFETALGKVKSLLNVLMDNLGDVNHFALYKQYDRDDSPLLRVTLSADNGRLAREFLKIADMPAEPEPDETKDELAELDEIREIVVCAATEAHVEAQKRIIVEAQKRIIAELEKRGFEVFAAQPPMTDGEISGLVQLIKMTQPPIMCCRDGHKLPGPFDFPVTDNRKPGE